MPVADLVFIATYFVGNGEAGAYMAVSEDGYKFDPIVAANAPILKPTVGKDKLMRDPCVLKGPDGQWTMVWTTGWWDDGIGIAHSKDLFHWSEQQYLPVMRKLPGSLNAWAPEIDYDPATKRYIVFWSSTIPGRFPQTERADGDLGPNREPLDHRFYYTTTADFKSYSATQIMWDPGFNCIDASLLFKDGKWLLFGKDETKAPDPRKFLFLAQARSPMGPFSMQTPKLTGNFWAEGPTAVDLGDRIRVYFDRYTEGRWGAVESTDLSNWTDVSSRVSMVSGARHGTIRRVERKIVDVLRRALRNKRSEPYR